MILLDLIKKYGIDSLIEHDLSISISKISSENAPEPQSLVFISKPESVMACVEKKAGAIVVPASHKDQVPKNLPINVLSHKNPRLMMAIINKNHFAPDKLLEQFDGMNSDISMAAIIHPSCKIAHGVKIGPNVVIGKNVTVEPGCIIGASSVIQSESKIGAGTRIHELSFIGKGSQIGADCEIFSHAGVGTEGFGYAPDEKGRMHPINHEGRVVLESGVHVGAGTQIDRGTFGETRIGQETKIDNLCHIAHNCIIGKSGLITAGFKVAGSTTIGDFFTTGGNVTVAGHIKITDHVNLAGLSVVHKSITESGSYYGYPLKPLQEGLKNNAAFGSLSKMKKDLAKIKKILNI